MKPTASKDAGSVAHALSEIERLEEIFAGWDHIQRDMVADFRNAVDTLHRAALERLIRTFKANPSTVALLKEAATDPVVYTVLRHHGLLKPSLNERVEAALDTVRPLLKSHGGDVTLVQIDPPTIALRFSGSCDGCAASALTFQAGVVKAVKDACPEITDVRQVRNGGPNGDAHFVSPFSLSPKGKWQRICSYEDLADNSVCSKEIDAHAVVLFRRGKAITCFQDACAHLGHSLRDGTVEDGVITCPHHGFRYELARGECLTMPDLHLQALAVRVIAGRVEVRFPT
jgi:Fe-S cluster biogenesis protein NfuA/nitrite reductase/ring-hydroxylating ferredoxin subunit